MPAAVSRMDRISHELVPQTGAVTISAAYQMKAYDQLVRFAAGATYTITLPPVAEAAGKFYVIRCISGTATVTVVDKGDARVAVSDTMNADNEVQMMYSDGEMWHFIIIPPA